MDDLEQQLRRAFQPEEPPADLTERILERTRSRRVAPRWMAAAASVLIAVSAGYGYRWHQGQTAKRELLMAFRITSTKLNHIQMQVVR
ncbi:MAG TPA: hypothetical protein VHW24_01710 [Bryobacteraceae bacterium]|jgi:hypothetical protein|nr:hypothetical protein [Bryobacteraceae bacterium]